MSTSTKCAARTSKLTMEKTHSSLCQYNLIDCILSLHSSQQHFQYTEFCWKDLCLSLKVFSTVIVKITVIRKVISFSGQLEHSLLNAGTQLPHVRTQ